MEGDSESDAESTKAIEALWFLRSDTVKESSKTKSLSAFSDFT